MAEQPRQNRMPFLFGCLFLSAVPLTLFAVWTLAVFSAFGHKAPWSLADKLPKSLVVLEEFSDRSGMDSFFLLKARYSSEDEINQICKEFLLLADLDDISALSFAGLVDERSDIPWFPLPNVSQRYAFNSVNFDGTLKENAEGRYESVLWIDDEKKVLILQLACL